MHPVLTADGTGKVNEEREQTLNQLLTEMDGFTPDTGVVFIGATNRWAATWVGAQYSSGTLQSSGLSGQWVETIWLRPVG